ncbi:MAG: GEVED domain-containing protein, partial [Bacteroidota bacterium]
GSKVDAEPNGQPSITAGCDDNDCLYPSAGDDEDGVIIPTVVMIGSTVNITVQASVNGYLDLWIDYNVDGDWADPGEHVFTTLAVSSGPNLLSFVVPATAAMGQSYARFRFRTTNTPISYSGLLMDGEVEDYPVYINDCEEGTQLDFGDAPDNPAAGFNYPTLLSSNGARHIMFSNIRLGALIDGESNGQPNIQATGDNISTSNDEDGVGFIGTMYVGQTAIVTVTASISGYLNAWMDFNKDGDWADPGEQIFTNQPLSAGINTLSFPIPLAAQPGKTYMRFRFNTIGGLTYTGLATDGEVEDYRVHSCPNWKPQSTQFRHLILVPNTLPDLHDGDVLGVFYHDKSGNLACGGLVDWSSTDNQVMVAYGDNPATPDIIEGFVVGEPFVWMICSGIKGDSYPVDVIYDVDFPSHNGLFAMNGMSALTNVIGLHVSASAVPANICTGQSVQLSSTVPANATDVTFIWTSSPPGFISGLQNPVVFPLENTSYFVEAFDGAFHAHDTVVVKVTSVNPLESDILVQNVTVPANQSKCYNATQTITVAGNGTSFTVDKGGNVQMVAGLSIHLLPSTKISSGGYLHAYISANGNYCCNIPQAPATKQVAWQEKPGNKIRFFNVYPNPTSGNFTIEMRDASELSPVSVEIYGIMGETEGKYDSPGFTSHIFDLSDKKPGIYLIKVMTGGEMGMTKIIKQ